MHSGSEESRSWLDRNGWIVMLIVVLIVSVCTVTAPREARSAELGATQTDSLLSACGSVTRSHYLGDTLRVWIEGRDEKTQGPFNFINGPTVEVGRTYVIVFYSKSRIVHRADPPQGGKCTAPAPKSAGVFHTIDEFDKNLDMCIIDDDVDAEVTLRSAQFLQPPFS